MLYLQCYRCAPIARVVACFTISLCLALSASASFADDPCPSPPTAIVEGVVDPDGLNSTIAMRACGEFIVAWEEERPEPGYPYHQRKDVFVQRYDADGTLNGTSAIVSDVNQFEYRHYDPSIAISAAGKVRVGWIAKKPVGCLIDCYPELLIEDFDFDPFDVEPKSCYWIWRDSEPSVAIVDDESPDDYAAAVVWSNTLRYATDGDGLVYRLTGDPIERILDCPSYCVDRLTQWQPCISMRESDGAYAIVWADAEVDLQLPPFNIAIQIYDASGTLLDELVGPTDGEWVNEPAHEAGDSIQKSPAVSFDDDGNLVVCWVGFPLPGCSSGGFRIFARRLKFESGQLRDPDPAQGEGRAGMFMVDSDPDTGIDPYDAYPTVAINVHADPADPSTDRGAFIIAWNADNNINGHAEIRGQYFLGDGQPKAGEVRLNQADGADNVARLARSGAHTLAYGPDEQVALTWTEGSDGGTGVEGVYVTLLPWNYWKNGVPDCDICQSDPSFCMPCIKADVNGDCAADGLDVEPFVELLLSADMTCFDVVDLCPADTDNDGDIDVDDIPCFVLALLGEPCGGDRGLSDCNDNGIPDANDIAYGTSEDCNENYIPDECDIDPTDPDGNGETSNDLNANTIPDECEPDCNENGVPDDKDIADETSTDVNSNGIPDECDPDCNDNDVPDDWDISQETSADCNENGTPDECEPDCNNNGVPDDCDLDPTDPDGDEFVSEDCNENNYPDECDLTLPPGFGSLDCNANDIPDECDLADCEGEAWCDDCNENGFLDVCDIAAEISDDENENGIPDECEGEGLMGGGGAPMGAPSSGPTFGPVDDDSDAWAAFFEWSMDQSWGSDADMSGAAQFQMMVNKLDELGLPLADPWYMISTTPES